MRDLSQFQRLVAMCAARSGQLLNLSSSAAACGIIRCMNRADTLSILSHHKPEMQRRFGVRSLALFGSCARGESRAGSDIDMLVEFDGLATSERYFGLQFFLEDLLRAPVDLVTRRALRPQLRPFIEREAIDV